MRRGRYCTLLPNWRDSKLPKYKIRFEATMVIEAKNAAEAIKESWLTKNLVNATYKYLDCKREGQ